MSTLPYIIIQLEIFIPATMCLQLLLYSFYFFYQLVIAIAIATKSSCRHVVAGMKMSGVDCDIKQYRDGTVS
jgi:hypothetical protein